MGGDSLGIAQAGLNLLAYSEKESVFRQSHDLNFNCGYGLGTHAYFVTREYIKSIIYKYEKLPEPNGRHIDFEICFNIIDNDNKIYSNKCFFVKEECFKQLVDKSDNYLNIIDEMFRFDINKQIEYNMDIFKVLKKMILNDNQIKIIQWFMNYFGTVNMNKKQDLLKGLQLFFNN